MKKIISLFLVVIFMTINASIAFAAESPVELYVDAEASAADRIVYQAVPITNDVLLLDRAKKGINDAPISVTSNVKIDMLSNNTLLQEQTEVFTTTQRLQERITPDNERITTYATYGYAVTKTEASVTHNDIGAEGRITMKLALVYDYFDNASGVRYYSPRTFTYTYVSKASVYGNVRQMEVSYQTGNYGYDSNADLVTRNGGSSDSTTKVNPSPGNQISLTYYYGGSRFFKSGECQGRGRWTDMGTGTGTIWNGVSYTLY